MKLKLEGLTKEFQGIRAVQNVTCTLTNGVYGLLGVNGAGKTTLMRMLCTLLAPTEGRILYNEKDIFGMGAEYRRLLGYLPQDFGYYPDFTVQDYLMYIASIKGVSPAAARKRVAELLAVVKLEKVQNKKMKKLSGGMKRRAGIAQAMLNDPKILILDEPTAGLDPNERIRFRNLMNVLAQDRLVLVSTHIVSDIEYAAKEILLMKDGEIVHSGTLEEVILEVPVKAWRLSLSKKEAERYVRGYKTVNIKTTGNGAELRLLSETRPHSGAEEDALTLEDVFLYYFGEKEGEEDAAL